MLRDTGGELKVIAAIISTGSGDSVAVVEQSDGILDIFCRDR